jgi:hypothetical protein
MDENLTTLFLNLAAVNSVNKTGILIADGLIAARTIACGETRNAGSGCGLIRTQKMPKT